MNRIGFVLSLGMLLLSFGTNAQEPLKVTTYKLDNGLKVVLAEEHSQPKVFGGVFVHAGSKNEDPNITGVAHYFEHMMFKGTDRIGTTNWKEESLYLDSISWQYDLLHATDNEEARAKIQKEINRLNIAASKYAIPNEVDAILSKLGGTGLNAGTSYDYTVYYNQFPSNQIENWMDVYVERFRYPVFRLFQSELEAVYEEKNMYEDSPVYGFQRKMFSVCFGEHPYSRDVIGLGEHLKNPQPSEMRRFFDTYYVANNMTLIMVGDFDTKELKPLIEKKFGKMRSGVLPERPVYELPKFEKQVVEEVKLTPIPMGMIVFPGVKAGHPDDIPLEVLSSLLSGGNGLMDKAVTEGKIMMATYMNGSLEDAGINMVMYVPTLLTQSHAEAEKVVWDCLDSIKAGRFSDEMLEAIKTQELVYFDKQQESLEGISSLLQSLEMSGQSYDEWVRDIERLQKITREDVIAIANKYFSPEHCTIVRSKMGFPKKDVVSKPDWEHLEAQNIGVQSEYAKEIYGRTISSVEPQRIEVGKDVVLTSVTDDFTLYSSPNAKNDLFSLNIVYNYGLMDDPDLRRATDYFSMLGAGDKDLEHYNRQLELLGADFSITVDDDHTTLSVSGREKNLNEILALVASRFSNPRHDDTQIKLIIDAIKAEEKTAKDDADQWFSAITEYVRYGDNSSFLRQTPLKEWRKRNGEALEDEVCKIFGRNGYVTYSGNVPSAELAVVLRASWLVRPNVERVKRRAFKEQIPQQNSVFYVHNKKFGQSNIMILLPSVEVEQKDKPMLDLFNEYFGGGMNSIVFQEIREFRSLGYSTFGTYRSDDLHVNAGKLLAYLGTQCDKTNEGIDALLELIRNVPMREDKFSVCRDFDVLALNSQYYSFRTLPGRYCYWKEVLGVENNPNIELAARIPSITMEDLAAFVDKYIAGKPVTIVVSGNAKRFDVKALQKYGKVTQLKQKDIMRF